MHAFFHGHAARRRAIWPSAARSRAATTTMAAPVAPAARAARVPTAAARTCVMQMTVDTDAVTALRALAMRLCGDSLEFMRIEACEHGARMKVWLCVGVAMVGRVMEAVMQALPGAEFGRFVERPAP